MARKKKPTSQKQEPFDITEAEIDKIYEKLTDWRRRLNEVFHNSPDTTIELMQKIFEMIDSFQDPKERLVAHLIYTVDIAPYLLQSVAEALEQDEACQARAGSDNNGSAGGNGTSS